MKKLLLTVFCVFNIAITPQSIGAFLGGGIINANSPNITSAAGSIFFETGNVFNTNAAIRFSFLYSTDINQVLPSTTNRYSPFVKGISIKGISSQLSKNFYVEEGVGVIALNDRVFSDVNEIDFGFVTSVGAGFDLRKNKPTGFRIGAGTDYGFTFTNTYAKYFSLYLQTQYYF